MQIHLGTFWIPSLELFDFIGKDNYLLQILYKKSDLWDNICEGVIEEMEKKFEKVSANEQNSKWEQIIARQKPIYHRENELRTEFGRDYGRILFSNSYRRLKNKTQVFFSPKDDHICTRAEHVNTVESISYTIASALGLNPELTKAIAVAHDLGHSPFGHRGEKVLNQISQYQIGQSFWHEKNGVYLVDKIELLEDDKGQKQNLDLTYAVRDGIISHCGEIDENALKPRIEAIDLDDYTKPNEYAPYTWEACVVKISDKISYLGRDIEDAISIGILEEEETEELKPFFKNAQVHKVNNTVIINNLIGDLCQNSTPETGLAFSEDGFALIKKIKEFNYEKIYKNARMSLADRYIELVIKEIFYTLLEGFAEEKTEENLKKLKKTYPELVERFSTWISQYSKQEAGKQNEIIYNIQNKQDYIKAVITYISGMTDKYAMSTYHDIISF